MLFEEENVYEREFFVFGSVINDIGFNVVEEEVSVRK
jgi:hypothetical protein